MEMPKSNYQIMKGQMAKRFLRYNQEQMTEKFQLPCDEEYIYVTFVSSLYRINRKTGEIQVQEPETKDWRQTDYNEAMSIYDVLCDSKSDCHLSGKFVSLNSLKSSSRPDLPSVTEKNRGSYEISDDDASRAGLKVAANLEPVSSGASVSDRYETK